MILFIILIFIEYHGFSWDNNFVTGSTIRPDDFERSYTCRNDGLFMSSTEKVCPPKLQTHEKQATTEGRNHNNIRNSLKMVDSIPLVDIDPEGKFKYILIQVKDETNNKLIHLVRGYRKCSFHADILEDVEENELKPFKKKTGLKVKWSCPGGGRILHKPNDKSILVYGYSQGFGRGDHQMAVELLKQKYPEYSNIEWSNEGY